MDNSLTITVGGRKAAKLGNSLSANGAGRLSRKILGNSLVVSVISWVSSLV